MAGLAERFWAKVERRGDDECWPWRAYRKRGGYGQFHVRRHPVLAHRFAYESEIGPIPVGLTLDHLCSNPACCNPAHLEPVTSAVNTERYYGAQVECRRGHGLLDPANVRLATHRRGDRVYRLRECRACDALRARGYREAKHG